MKRLIVLFCLVFLGLACSAENVFTLPGGLGRALGIARSVPQATSFTVEGWLKLNQNSRQNSLWAQYLGNNGRINMYVANNRLEVFCGGGVNAAGQVTESETLAATTEVPNGAWTHVAFVRDEAQKTYAFYVNGIPAGSGSSACTKIEAVSSTFGGTKSTLMADDAAVFNGSLADIRVWTVARTADEIARNRNRRLSAAETGLFAYLPFDRKSVNATTDLVGSEVCTVPSSWQLTGDQTLVLEPAPANFAKGVGFAPQGKGSDATVATGLRMTGTAFTIEGWYRLDALNAKNGIVYQNNKGNGRMSYEVDYDVKDDQSVKRFACWFGGYSLYSPYVPLDTWIHVAMVRNGTKGICYTNGVEATTTETFPPYGIDAIDMVLFANSAAGIANAFSGSVRELRVWNVARSAADIGADMWRTVSAPTEGLLACWPLREKGGSRLVNVATGSTNDLSSTGTGWPWKAGVVPIPAETDPVGDVETGAQFTGTKFSSGSTEFSLTGSDFTFEAWACPRPYGLLAGHSSSYGILQQGTGSDAGRVAFALKDGRIAFSIGTTVMLGQTDVLPDAWTHLAVTRQAGTVRLYRNGVCDGEWTDAPQAPLPVGASLLVGGADAEVFDGWLREVRVWDHACTADEIRERFRYQLRGGERGLLGYYALDTVGTTLVNGRRGGPDGTLQCAWTPSSALDLLGRLPSGFMLIFR